jgi:hypothetical protein
MEADSAQTEEAEAQPTTFSESATEQTENVSDKEKTEEVNVESCIIKVDKPKS